MENKINVWRFKGNSFKAEQISPDQFGDFIEKMCFEESLPIMFLIHLGIQDLSQIASKLEIEIVDVAERCDYLIDKGLISNVENDVVVLTDEQRDQIVEILKNADTANSIKEGMIVSVH